MKFISRRVPLPYSLIATAAWKKGLTEIPLPGIRSRFYRQILQNHRSDSEGTDGDGGSDGSLQFNLHDYAGTLLLYSGLTAIVVNFGPL